MKIVLIGFMGAGKTSVAKLLSQKLQLNLIELDDLITDEIAPLSIAQLINTKGEREFRQYETSALQKVLQSDNFILSPGGGVITSDENRTAIKESGARVFFLNAEFDVIFKRIKADKERPLVKDYDQTKELYEKRLALYRELTDCEVDTGSQIEQTIETIIKTIKQ